MEDLTFGEQVKIILGRKGMTIKELAEIIEERTGSKMSRQNLTQRLGRDNFQEQDMRMIANILESPFRLSILSSELSAVSRMNAAETEVPTEQELRKIELKRLQKVKERQPAVYTEQKHPESGSYGTESTEVEMTIGELYEIHEELSELEEEVEAEAAAKAAAEAETPNTEASTGDVETAVSAGETESVEVSEAIEVSEPIEEVEYAEAGEPIDIENSAAMEEASAEWTEENLTEELESTEELDSPEEEKFKESDVKEYVIGTFETKQEKKDRFRTAGIFLRRKGEVPSAPKREEKPVRKEEDLEIEDFEPVIKHDDVEENLNLGEVNPYTGREFQSNSVRMHPSRIGYVQVYDRTIHRWTDMTEWAFLGYQERKKALLGKEYEPPIYLD